MKNTILLSTLLLASLSCLATETENRSKPAESIKAGATEYIILCAAPNGTKFIVKGSSDGTGMPCINATDNGTGR